jgi:hypothetical protein
LRQTFTNWPFESGSTNVTTLSCTVAPLHLYCSVTGSTTEKLHVSSLPALSEKRRISTACELSGAFVMR